MARPRDVREGGLTLRSVTWHAHAHSRSFKNPPPGRPASRTTGAARNVRPVGAAGLDRARCRRRLLSFANRSSARATRNRGARLLATARPRSLRDGTTVGFTHREEGLRLDGSANQARYTAARSAPLTANPLPRFDTRATPHGRQLFAISLTTVRLRESRLRRGNESSRRAGENKTPIGPNPSRGIDEEEKGRDALIDGSRSSRAYRYVSVDPVDLCQFAEDCWTR